MKNRIDLCGAWSFCDEQGNRHQGIVPGCVHTDLFETKELFLEKNSEKGRFIEEHDWTYEKDFQVEELQNGAELVFEGLDTYCEVYLNDICVGQADNMFIPHRFAVDGVLREGENHLEVRFQSPVRAVEGKKALTGAFTTERLHSRRLQCTYGWDWVDRFVTCGIFRPAYLVFENKMSLEHVYVYTNNVDAYSAQIKVTETFRNFAEGSVVKTEIIDPAGTLLASKEHYSQEQESILYFDIEEPKLWYPRPYGEQPLYTLRICVGEQTVCQKFGIRTVKILQLQDKEEAVINKCKKLQDTVSGKGWDQNEEYSGFILIINGVKIYCTGANWVPCEPFPSAEREAKMTEILEKAADAGLNMLRIWGGGLFEKQHLYEECDRLGILVTQDFLMACGTYPEDEVWFQEQLKKEAEFAALYLRNHPSLVWWTGDNENAVAGCDTDENYQGRISARKIIAPVLEKLDHNRVFLFSSPYGGKRYASKTVGTTHNTQFLGDIFEYTAREELSDYREYWKEYTARFIAEEPSLGAVCKKSLSAFISEENQEQYDMWLHHTKTNPALSRELMDIIVDFAEKLFGPYRDWEDRYFKLRYLQYEWVRFTLGYARSYLWFNSGIIYWMLNDCWPAAIGWSFIDYYNRPKAGYYAMKAFAKPLAMYMEKTDHGYQVNISDILESQTKADMQLKVNLLHLKDGKSCPVLEKQLSGEMTQYHVELDAALQKDEILIAELKCGEEVLRTWYKEGLPVLAKTDAIRYKVTEAGIEVWADTYVHAVEVDCGGYLSDNYFSLLPGEKRVLSYEPAEEGEQVSVQGYTFC